MVCGTTVCSPTPCINTIEIIYQVLTQFLLQHPLYWTWLTQYAHNTRKPWYFLHANIYISNLPFLEWFVLFRFSDCNLKFWNDPIWWGTSCNYKMSNLRQVLDIFLNPWLTWKLSWPRSRCIRCFMWFLLYTEGIRRII